MLGFFRPSPWTVSARLWEGGEKKKHKHTFASLYSHLSELENIGM